MSLECQWWLQKFYKHIVNVALSAFEHSNVDGIRFMTPFQGSGLGGHFSRGVAPGFIISPFPRGISFSMGISFSGGLVLRGITLSGGSPCRRRRHLSAGYCNAGSLGIPPELSSRKDSLQSMTRFTAGAQRIWALSDQAGVTGGFLSTFNNLAPPHRLRRAIGNAKSQ